MQTSPWVLSSIALGVLLGGCSKPVDEPASTFKPAPGTPPPAAPTKLEIKDLSPGTGRAAKAGDTVHVQYTGTLLDGTK
ncbi:MAG: FKBP-type peptidyl-prolyl cis-trans isomerase, partial [Polyangiaceae bacterium]